MVFTERNFIVKYNDINVEKVSPSFHFRLILKWIEGHKFVVSFCYCRILMVWTVSFLVANSNSSFYSGWSLSQSLSHVSLQPVHAPATSACTFATRGFQTLFQVTGTRSRRRSAWVTSSRGTASCSPGSSAPTLRSSPARPRRRRRTLRTCGRFT